jgi:hypothetical protein
MIPQQIGIAATFNTPRGSEISAYNKTIDKLPNQEAFCLTARISAIKD